jgi:hypothetical protein
MANRLYGKAKEALGGGLIDWVNDDIRVILLDLTEYTPNFDADETLENIPEDARVAVAALSGKTNTLGVLDANDVTFGSVTGEPVEAYVLYKHTGSEDTSLLILYCDGKFLVEVAAPASSSATSITIEDLPAPIGNTSVLTKISGTGPASIVTSASGAEGDRTLSVDAISSGITAGAVYEYMMTNTSFPLTPIGGNVTINFNNGPSKILAL